MNHFPIRDIWKIRHIWKIIHFGKDIFDLSSHIFLFYLENTFLQHWEKVKVIFSVSISVWSGHLTTMWNLKEINIPQSLYDIAVQSDNAYAVSTDNLLVSRRSSFSYFAFSSAYSRSTQLGLKQVELTTLLTRLGITCVTGLTALIMTLRKVGASVTFVLWDLSLFHFREN